MHKQFLLSMLGEGNYTSLQLSCIVSSFNVGRGKVTSIIQACSCPAQFLLSMLLQESIKLQACSYRPCLHGFFFSVCMHTRVTGATVTLTCT